ncbi:MAG: hypothetical protein IPN40_04365 [Uliginosibacterium sp.]|nr:hypothetical protein [Uliginosibacterium sp.]
MSPFHRPAGNPRLRLILSSMAAALISASACAEPARVPRALAAFIPAGSTLLDYIEADLNGDGTKDYAFILESSTSNPEAGERSLTIAVREADGALRAVKTNRKLVLCAQCGGVMGDPFNELRAEKNGFSVSHYGGSGWRWSNAFTFRYSGRDRSWQLTRAEKTSFHVAKPDEIETEVHRPPKDFGKIDLADFDPKHYLGVGPK